MSELESQIDVDALEVGDRIEWTEDWTSGAKNFAAEVVDVEQERKGATLSKPERLVTQLTLDVVEGDREDVDPSLMENNHEHAVVGIETEI